MARTVYVSQEILPPEGLTRWVRGLEERGYRIHCLAPGSLPDQHRPGWLLTTSLEPLAWAAGLGCRTILVDPQNVTAWFAGGRRPDFVAGNIGEACRLILSTDGDVQVAGRAMGT
jgi:hypothetical protein